MVPAASQAHEPDKFDLYFVIQAQPNKNNIYELIFCYLQIKRYLNSSKYVQILQQSPNAEKHHATMVKYRT